MRIGSFVNRSRLPSSNVDCLALSPAYLLPAVAVLYLTCLVGCTTSHDFPASTPGGATIASKTGTPVKVDKLPPGVADAPGQAQADYKIGPLDVLDISVFGVPDLTKTVEVSGSGQISYPLIGSVQALGKTTGELKAELEKKLGDKYLQSPEVEVAVKQATSQRVTVEGAVRESGMYPLVGETTLSQSIALAKGLNETADPHGVLLFRKINGKKNVAAFDLANIQKGHATDPVLQGGDVVVVDQSGFKAAWAGLRNALPLAGSVVSFVPLL